MTEFVHVKGLAALQKMLDQVPVELEKKIMRTALRRGMQPILDDARLNAPKDTGLMAEGLKLSTVVKNGAIVARVRAGGKHGFIAYWHEYTGARAHTIKAKDSRGLVVGGHVYRQVEHPGMKPHPFMRPALDKNAQASVMIVGEYIKKRLSTKKLGFDAADVLLEGDE